MAQIQKLYHLMRGILSFGATMAYTASKLPTDQSLVQFQMTLVTVHSGTNSKIVSSSKGKTDFAGQKCELIS